MKGFVYVTKDEAGELIVFSPVCTHLGCTINLSSETEKKTRSDMLFSCPCHGAQFDIKGNEIRLHLRPLDTYLPVIAGGNVYIQHTAILFFHQIDRQKMQQSVSEKKHSLIGKHSKEKLERVAQIFEHRHGLMHHPLARRIRFPFPTQRDYFIDMIFDALVQ